MDPKEAGPSGAVWPDSSALELESLRSAARWIVGAAAAVLAVMLAGVQLSAVSKIDEFTVLRVGGSLLAGLVGLACAGTVLWLAARVLVPPRWTLTKLAHLELTQPEAWQEHWANAELRGQRALLTPTSELRLAPLYRHHRALFVASVELVECGEAVVRSELLGDSPTTVIYRASEADDGDRLQQRLALARELADRITDVVNIADVYRRYRLLVRLLPWLGGAAMLSVAGFIWATSPPSGAPVTSPIRVQVQFTTDQAQLDEARIPAGCSGLTVNGVAVGGTLEEPVVTSVERAECVLRQVKVPKEAGAVIPHTPTK